jgi:oligoribonuclease (3'-5' exoribonuclease)
MPGTLQPPPALESNGLCIFDCETTGLDPLQDEMIQAAWIITDFTGQDVKTEGMVRILPTR